MNSYPKQSFQTVDIENWRWKVFLDDAIKGFDCLSPNPIDIPIEFRKKENTIGSGKSAFNAITHTWVSSTQKLRNIRAACVEAGSVASVLNFLACPLERYDLPFFGADFVTLKGGHLLALDLQPVLNDDQSHREYINKYLLPIFNKWKKLIPSGGDIPEEAKTFFSPGFIWTRLPLGSESDKFICEVLRPIFQEYLELYIYLVKEATEVDSKRSSTLMSGQNRYLDYRIVNDPARKMLTGFYGKSWTECYIKDVLFANHNNSNY